MKILIVSEELLARFRASSITKEKLPTGGDRKRRKQALHRLQRIVFRVDSSTLSGGKSWYRQEIYSHLKLQMNAEKNPFFPRPPTCPSSRSHQVSASRFLTPRRSHRLTSRFSVKVYGRAEKISRIIRHLNSIAFFPSTAPSPESSDRMTTRRAEGEGEGIFWRISVPRKSYLGAQRKKREEEEKRRHCCGLCS